MRTFITVSAVICLLMFIVPQILFGFGWAAGKIFAFRLSYKPFFITSVFLVVLSLIILIYGHFAGMRKYEVKEIKIESAILPKSFDGYRIVQLSDIHLKSMEGNEKFLEQVVEKVNSLQPDIICITGDLTTYIHTEIDPFAAVLKGLRATDGVCSIMGNHDYAPYTPFKKVSERREAIEKLIEKERNLLGWDLLMNENRIIRRGGDSIAVAGVENQSYSFNRNLQFADLNKALAGTSGMFTVLLTHDPAHWRAEVLPETDVPLTLSGHTHAAQIKIGNFTPASWVFKETDGLYEQDGRYLYINAGLGGVVPFRLGAYPEITLIELKSKD